MRRSFCSTKIYISKAKLSKEFDFQNFIGKSLLFTYLININVGYLGLKGKLVFIVILTTLLHYLAPASFFALTLLPNEAIRFYAHRLIFQPQP